MYYYSREKEEKRKRRRERERDLSVFFSFWLRNVVLIKSSRAHSARHEFISHSHSLPCHHHRQEETRTLIRDSLSLSLCVLVVVVVVCFHFSPTKVGVRYKNKNSLPSSLSLVLDESLRSSSAQMYMLQLCNQRTPRVLHKGRDLFFCHHRRALSLLRPYERERERERERKRKKEKSAQKRRRRKFCIYKIRETWKKNKSLLLLFCRDSRERDRLRNPATYMITQFCQNFWKDLLVIIIA